jgi:Ca2+-binding RTX toxin-like protein
MATIHGSNSGEVIDMLDGVTDGSDLIFGEGGIDTIYAAGGNDVLKGGGGADKLYGGAGTDTADYSDSDSGVEVSLAAGAGAGGTAEGDKLYEIENLSGSAFDDTLAGDENANSLYGEAGNDVLKGGGGTDKLYGGSGDDQLNSDAMGDVLDGGTGNDTANFADAQAGVAVNLAYGRFNWGTHLQPVPQGTPDNIVNVESVYGSNTHDYIVGDGQANVLTGNGGVDRIWGGDGADVINGGSGNDLLNGGGANDTFVFNLNAAGDVDLGKDTISDFTDGQDRLQFDDGIFGSFAEVQAAMQQVGNDVVITIDADNSIKLTNVAIGSLGASDFLFV